MRKDNLGELLGQLTARIAEFLFRSLLVMWLFNVMPFTSYEITYLQSMGLLVLCGCLFKVREVKILGDN